MPITLATTITPLNYYDWSCLLYRPCLASSNHSAQRKQNELSTMQIWMSLCLESVQAFGWDPHLMQLVRPFTVHGPVGAYLSSFLTNHVPTRRPQWWSLESFWDQRLCTWDPHPCFSFCSEYEFSLCCLKVVFSLQAQHSWHITREAPLEHQEFWVAFLSSVLLWHFVLLHDYSCIWEHLPLDLGSVNAKGGRT